MNPDKLFADMAKLYADKEGEQLNKENERLVSGAPFTPSLDFERNIRAKIRAEKYRRPVYIMSSIAACAILALISLNVLPGLLAGGGPRGAQGTQMAANAPGESRTTSAAAAAQPGESRTTSAAAIAQPGRQEQAGQPGRQEQNGQPGQAGQPGQPAQPGQPGQPGLPAGAGSAGHEMIALAFNLPPNCSVRDVEQDVGQTVYHISNTKKDDIVLIAEKSAETGGTGRFSEEALRGSGLVKIEINGTALYAAARPDYNYFTFQRDGVIYNMTCRYDYKTLVSLCEYIL